MTTAVSEREPPAVFTGIYDVPEAARYLKAASHGSELYPASSAKLTRWIRRGLASPDLAGLAGNELLIAFEDLVSMRVIAALRSVGVRWAEIDRTGRWLRETTGCERPFATEYLWTGHGQVFVDWTRRLVSASRNGQLALGMLRDYLVPVHGMAFDDATGVPTSWEPLNGIVLAPEVQFGAPCLKGTRIPARAVSGMVEAGDGEEWVADAYGLTREEVRAACAWESRVHAA